MRKKLPAPALEARAKSEDVHSGLSPATIARAFRDNLAYRQARFPAVASQNDNYMALAYAVRDRLLHRWINTARTYFAHRSRSVCYLSAEFLMGPQFANNLVNLGIYPQMRTVMKSLGLNLGHLLTK